MSSSSWSRSASFVGHVVLWLPLGGVALAQRELSSDLDPTAASEVQARNDAVAGEEAPGLEVVLDGVVFEPDGSAAQGAVVVSSAGGEALTAADGSYQFQVRVPFDA